MAEHFMLSDRPLPAPLAAGLNQTKKHIIRKTAVKIFLASDCDENIKKIIKALCEQYAVPLDSEINMEQLGKLCGLEVNCAVCAQLSK